MTYEIEYGYYYMSVFFIFISFFAFFLSLVLLIYDYKY